MSTAIATQSAFGDRIEYWRNAIRTGLLPDKMTAEQAVLIEAKGRELGIPSLRAIQTLVVVKGRISMASEGMLALIYERAPEAIVNIVDCSAERAEIECQKTPRHKPATFTFTKDDAARAGLWNSGDNWRKYPQDMLYWRCVSRMARKMFPEILQGVLSAEEAEDYDRPAIAVSQSGARVSNVTQIVSASAAIVAQAPAPAIAAEAANESPTTQTLKPDDYQPQQVADLAAKMVAYVEAKGISAQELLAIIGRDELSQIDNVEIGMIRDVAHVCGKQCTTEALRAALIEKFSPSEKETEEPWPE